MTSAPAPAHDEPPFRIAIDIRPMAGPACGYSIHLASVIALLRKANFDLTLLINRPVEQEAEELAGLKTITFGSSRGIYWELRDLPKYLAGEDFDLYLSNANRGIPWRKNPRTRYLLGLLDIIPYKFARDYILCNWRYRLTHPHYNTEILSQLISVFRADSILTISEQSAADISSMFHRRNVTSCFIRLKDVALPTNLEVKDQFAYIGGTDTRKKVDVLLRAFARFVVDHPRFNLVLIGPRYDACLPLIDELGLRDRIRMTGFIDHETKFRTIGESTALVYPSTYEGYGLVIAEGMQAGVPVIAGRGGSQAEVGGDAVRYVDPTSVDEIFAAMQEMLDSATRDAWIARGREQLQVLTDPGIESKMVDYFVEQGRLSRARRERATARV